MLCCGGDRGLGLEEKRPTVLVLHLLGEEELERATRCSTAGGSRRRPRPSCRGRGRARPCTFQRGCRLHEPARSCREGEQSDAPQHTPPPRDALDRGARVSLGFERVAGARMCAERPTGRPRLNAWARPNGGNVGVDGRPDRDPPTPSRWSRRRRGLGSQPALVIAWSAEEPGAWGGGPPGGGRSVLAGATSRAPSTSPSVRSAWPLPCRRRRPEPPRSAAAARRHRARRSAPPKGWASSRLGERSGGRRGDGARGTSSPARGRDRLLYAPRSPAALRGQSPPFGFGEPIRSASSAGPVTQWRVRDAIASLRGGAVTCSSWARPARQGARGAQHPRRSRRGAVRRTTPRPCRPGPSTPSSSATRGTSRTRGCASAGLFGEADGGTLFPGRDRASFPRAPRPTSCGCSTTASTTASARIARSALTRASYATNRQPSALKHDLPRGSANTSRCPASGSRGRRPGHRAAKTARARRARSGAPRAVLRGRRGAPRGGSCPRCSATAGRRTRASSRTSCSPSRCRRAPARSSPARPPWRGGSRPGGAQR